MARLTAIWERVQELFALRGVRLAGARALAPEAPVDTWEAGVGTEGAATYLGISHSQMQAVIRQGKVPALWRTSRVQWIRWTDLQVEKARRQQGGGEASCSPEQA
jgi:hypothetical protein